VIERINGFIDEAFRHDERVAEMLEAAGPDEQARVRRELSLPASGEVLAPPSKYLEKALALATAARKRDSLDPVLRDAQYYLHTRSRVASSPGLAKPFTAMAGGAFAVLWDFAKWVLPEGAEAALMQKDPDRPNSPPGGWVWGVLGCSDGLLDLERDRGRPRHAKRTPREELRMMLQGHAAAARWAAPR